MTTVTLREAAQQAIDALEWADNGMTEGEPLQVNTQEAIKTLRAALDAPVKPVDCRGCAELLNIADVKRFNREKFRDDTEWADWAQSRACYASNTKVTK